MTAQPVTDSPIIGADQRSSASKVLALLTAMLHGGRGTVSLTEVALAAALPKSTTHRLLKVLEEQGFVDREGHSYRIGDAFLELAETARWSPYDDLRNVAYPGLAGVFERSNAVAVHLAVLRGRSIHYLDKLMRPDGIRLPSRVGGRLPAACTGLGKAMLAVGPVEALEEVLVAPLPRATPHSVTAHGQLLAQLRHVRDDGFVVEREEACHGFVCIAAPILLAGNSIAAVSVTLATVAVGRSRQGRVAEVGRRVSATAEAVGRALAPPADGHGVPAAGTVHSLRGGAQIDFTGPGPTTSKEQSVVR